MATSQDNTPTITEQVFTNVLATAYSVQEWQDRLKARTSACKAEQLMTAVLDTQGLVWRRGIHPETAVELIASRSQKLCGAGGTAIALLKGENLEYRAATGIAAGMLGRTILADASRSFQQLRSEAAVESDTWTDKALGTRVRANSVLSMPIYSQGELAGCIQMFSRVGQFGEDSKLTCELMSAILGELIAGIDSLQHKPAEFEAPRDNPTMLQPEVKERGATRLTSLAKDDVSMAQNLSMAKTGHRNQEPETQRYKLGGHIQKMIYPALVLLFVAAANAWSRKSGWPLELATIVIVVFTVLELSRTSIRKP